MRVSGFCPFIIVRVFIYNMKEKSSLLQTFMRYDNIENRFPFYAYIEYSWNIWINVRYIRDILVELFFSSLYNIIPSKIYTCYVYIVGRVSEDLFRQFWIEGKDWSCHTRVILLRTGCSSDRAHIVFGCPLFGSFLSSTSTVSAHLNTNSRLEGGENEKKLMCVWYNNIIIHMYLLRLVVVLVESFSRLLSLLIILLLVVVAVTNFWEIL